MGVHLTHFPEYGLDLNVYSGAVSMDEMLSSLRCLDRTANWLAIFCEDADLSRIDIAHFPAIKEALTAEKRGSGAGPSRRRSALVNWSGSNELFVRFWSAFASSGIPASRERAVFSTLDAAREWLGLPPR